MKSIFVLAAIVCSVATYSQDIKKIKSIDSLVNVINGSNYRVLRDSTKLTGMRAYETLSFTGTEVKKYVNDMLLTSTDNKPSDKTHVVCSYYFDQNKLIKVEQNRVNRLGTNYSDWYFANDKPLYNTSKEKDAQQHALTLLDEAKTVVQNMGFK